MQTFSSRFRQAQVDGLDASLPAPHVELVSDNYVDIQLLTPKGLKVVIPPYKDMQNGDRITLTWDGAAGIHQVSHNVSQSKTVEMYVPRITVLTAMDTEIQLYYLVDRAGESHKSVIVNLAVGSGTRIVVEDYAGAKEGPFTLINRPQLVLVSPGDWEIAGSGEGVRRLVAPASHSTLSVDFKRDFKEIRFVVSGPTRWGWIPIGPSRPPQPPPPPPPPATVTAKVVMFGAHGEEIGSKLISAAGALDEAVVLLPGKPDARISRLEISATSDHRIGIGPMELRY